MNELNKDELVLIAKKLDFYDLINFSNCNKNVYNFLNKRDDIWKYKLDKENLKMLEGYNSRDSYIITKNLVKLKKMLKIHNSISGIIKIDTLIKKNLTLTKIPKEIYFLTNLTKLILNENKIRIIPKQIGNLIKLKILYLIDNLIEELPIEIGELINLENLMLTYNKLKTIPKEISNLTKLKMLYINENPISKIPEEIEHMDIKNFVKN